MHTDRPLRLRVYPAHLGNVIEVSQDTAGISRTFPTHSISPPGVLERRSRHYHTDMNDSIHTVLAAWVNFYLVTGTAAAALTGLQFVVQTLLVSNVHRTVVGADPEAGIGAFGSPTVVHFTIALLLSAIMCAPWPDYDGLRASAGTMGLGAVIYSGVVLRRTTRQRIYAPTMEDWLWHIMLPTGAYVSLLASAWFLDHAVRWPHFALGASTLLLLCVGIHNAWDTVTYFTIAAFRREHGLTAPAKPAKSSNARGKRRQR